MEFRQREEEIMANYMQKIEYMTEKYDEELLSKERTIANLNKKVELALQEK
jgi:hypothetical protein